ncbi:hypothetical protein [Paenibacillus wenxiniae]|uniref:Antibiotic biosynthesis monooxygenase n=1 Tax=Paenibacillus wenxiniae TaxID=1636843 RepID=A0ABW4RFL0_9BACL
MAITRTWHGLVPIEQQQAFELHLQKTGIEHSSSIQGNVGAYVQIVQQGDYAHFFLCTVWSSWDAIYRFAGAQPSIAVTYPDDEQYGLISDPLVIHQEVIHTGNPFV